MSNIINSIEIYSMLVFEDANGNIYQDCVHSIDSSDIKTYNRRIIMTNCFELVIDTSTDSVTSIYGNDDYYDVARTLKLKEVWSRTDEDTYKKKYVWSDEFEQLIPYRKGYITLNRIEELENE